ncbi:MAG: nitrite reductase large subunit NirB [Gammaproteobacteria bacterium]
MKLRLVVIGNGMVGHKLIECLLESNTPAQYQVATFCEEPRWAYDRVHLSEFFSGKTASELSLVEKGFYERHGVTVFLNDRAVAIHRDRKRVVSAGGHEVPYDKLVLATGSYPFVPPVPGHDREGCFVYRTIEDLEAIKAAAGRSLVGTVVGGGLLGLEAANALQCLGMETHVVEFAPRLMAVQIDDGGGAILRKKIEDLGVRVHLSKNTTQIRDGITHAQCMSFADGECLETDLIVFSAGIRPRDDLARDAGLEIGQRGGICIDNHCRTSDPDIYAIGECAAWSNQVFGLVAPGYQMAKVAVSQLTGGEERFTGADMSTKLKLLGVDVASIGDAHAKTPGARAYTYIDEPGRVYKKLVVSENGKHLLGSVLIGDAENYGQLLQMALNGLEVPRYPDELILPQRGGNKSDGLGVDALPQAAQICACNNVSKAQLCGAIRAGATSLGSLKQTTKAATSCGGCGPLVTQILNKELARLGVAVKKGICEHFPYSRQELYHLVRVEHLATFAELIRRHGRGLGCDICKPAVASILAACWNEYILKAEHAGLQDTNDHYLANMQKDGTYSVVPRVPGGEITPEGLIALGKIAREHGLYTKITGAQRIDMFGARVEQLPRIWRQVVDAGFESGHAYGKALRTVKSCVGSTWCRFGVQDSVGLAIEIEHRYKGLRAPHKLKMAVSGCTRECAEAQGKDVGVIATEKGWNLYVCGNGGMKPRHADLFATDLDKDTLIRYIDRFFMFYIRTADRLQRTSVWLENLEGGLEYLKSVIIEDRLGIGEELERDMQAVINTYECEWKKTIEDPEKLRRFRHFVNSDEPDREVVFVQERGQYRPASHAERAKLANSA